MKELLPIYFPVLLLMVPAILFRVFLRWRHGNSKQPTPVDTLSTIPDWKAAHDAATIARAKHKRVNVHIMAMRQALHQDMGLEK